MGSRWFASEAAARRGTMYDPGRRSALRIGDVLYLYEGGMLSCGPRRVTGRSAAHIDRLARDWVSAGVSPCRDGSRGYNYRWWLDDSRSAAAACDLHQRAEARARRVVRRQS